MRITSRKVIAVLLLSAVVVAGGQPAMADVVNPPVPTLGGSNFVAVSPDGTHVVSVASTTGVTIYDASTSTSADYTFGLTPGTFELGPPVFVPDGASFYVSDKTASAIYQIRTSDGWLLGTYGYFGDQPPWALAISGDGGRLAVSRWDGSMVMLDIVPLNGFGTPFTASSNNIHQMCQSPDGTLAYSIDYGGSDVDVITIATGTVSATLTAPGMSGPISCAVDGDGNLFVGDYLLPQVHRFGTDGSVTSTSTLLFGGSGNVMGLTVLCGNVYAADRSSNTVVVLDANTLQERYSLTAGESTWRAYSGGSNDSAGTAWFGGAQDTNGLLGIEASACATPDPDLPNTGVDTMALTVAGGVALAILALGTALIVVRRRTS